MSIFYINRAPVEGPWGGGSKILRALIDELRSRKHDVVHELWPGIDVMICFDPRQGSSHSLLGHEKMLAHAKNAVKRPLIFQRVGDIGSHSKPELFDLVLKSVQGSDVVVYPSQWAHDSIMYALQMIDVSPTCKRHIIPNAPSAAFYVHRRTSHVLPQKLSFVTHHWSDNMMKGFDFYGKLASWAADNGHTFTFIGRAPKSACFNITPPMTENELAAELPKHDVYVTASMFEAGANHVLEAIACGLPVVYHKDGGSIVQYACDFGVQFDGSIASFEKALSELNADTGIMNRINSFKLTLNDVVRSYADIMEGALLNR